MSGSLSCRIRGVLVVLLLCSASKSMAQKPPSSLADALVNGMAGVLQTESWPCVYTGVFEQQRSLRGQSAAIRSAGQFLFDCQHGLLWESATPVASTQIYSNFGQRYAVNSTGRVKSLGGRVQARVASLLLSLMGGDASTLEKDFTHAVQGDDNTAVVLTPRRAALAQHIKQISVTHEQASINIQIASAAGGITRIRLLQMRTQKLPAVTICARQSPEAAIVCPLLFDAANRKK